MYSKTVSNKDSFLEQAKAAREERAMEKKRESSIVIVQARVRGWLCRRRFTRQVLDEFDSIIPEVHSKTETQEAQPVSQIPALDLYKAVCRFFIVFNRERDKARFLKLCKYIVHSVHSDSAKVPYVSVFFKKEYSISWLAQIKNILHLCCVYLDELNPVSPADMQCILVHLHTLIEFTSTSTWMMTKSKNFDMLRGGLNQLSGHIMGSLFHKGYYETLKTLLLRGICREKACLKTIALSAIVTLTLRPLVSAQFSEKILTMYIIHILSVPTLVYQLQKISPESITAILSHSLVKRTVDFLSADQNMRIVLNTLEDNYTLCLLGNLIQLAYLERDTESHETYCSAFVPVVIRFLEHCQQYVVLQKNSLANWHPVLGWLSNSFDQYIPPTLGNLRTQLALLWSSAMLKKLLESPLVEMLESSDVNAAGPSQPSTPVSSNKPVAFIRRALEARSNSIQIFRSNTSKNFRKLDSPEVMKAALICSMYNTALHTFKQIRLDILTGLCSQDKILYSLWQFICSLGPNCGLKAFLDQLAVNTKTSAPEFQMLILFSDCMTHYVTILDDLEMYEQQEPFKLQDFIVMSQFLNTFIYKSVMGQLFDLKHVYNNELFNALHMFLMVLYRRDCRRSYTPPNHWLIKDIRDSQFMTDYEKGKKPHQVLIQKTPHMIGHSERVRLFRKVVEAEKMVLSMTERACATRSTLVTVRRAHMVEDGYRQLAIVPSGALKGVVRVRFINEQGLDEAGIDQDGVFKEFLEETIKRVFDPSLNLFRATSEQRLYPSPTSSLHDDHLTLYEFIGRVLGKAVYEGIVVDVPFAMFFLSQALGQTKQALYSWIDELPSLDKDLYKSLTYVKHFEGDVSTLELTFSVDDDSLGQIITHELLPGGRAIPVTNENKINYIHLMAHFRMHTQIKQQTHAFLKGFRSIINPEWLSLFSAPELQRLISGDNVPLDLRDLRRHTQYYGGFHDSHRVVCWLWDVLQRDFDENERGMFLKFVTSCSKPPVLGFAHLRPPFSIRCVEVGDDEDTGDTIGSVIRGFFTIRKKDPLNRLPTSSTCFNLLKLPNYQKRSTLRDKLRYAVNSNTGFELS